jgi:large subunit ribosomal protein L6
MSRIGKVPVAVPKGVTISLTPTGASVKGPKGELKMALDPRFVAVSQANAQVTVERKGNDNRAKAMHGTTQRMLTQLVKGVTEGFQKNLEILGTGWRAEMQGKKLVCRLGYSHDVPFDPPAGIEIKTPEPTKVVITGIDKQQVGQVAAIIRGFRKPEPYKGKGVRYAGEYVRRKQGKAAK